MKLTLTMLTCILMAGCAYTLTEEEAVKACPEQKEECLVEALEKKVEEKKFKREYNREMDLQNWETCLRIYKASGAPTWHIGHTHERRGGSKKATDPFDVRTDLRNNQCRSIIRRAFGKDAWAERY